MFSVIGSVFSLVKVVRLTRLSDPSAPTEIVLFSMALALFCVTSWSFTFTLLVPYMAALPNFSRLEHRLKFVFLVCGVVTAVFPGSIPMFQLLDVNVKDRITASRALFWASSFNASLIMFVVGVAGHKVGFLYLSFSRLALSFRSLSNPHVAQLLALLGQSQKLASPRSTSSSSRPSELQKLASPRSTSSIIRAEPKSDDSLAKLRRKLARAILAIEGLCAIIIICCVGVVLHPILQKQAWLILAAIVAAGVALVNIALYLGAASSSNANGSGSVGPHSSSAKNSRLAKYKVTPAADMLNPVVILARSNLVAAASIRNKIDFLPPQEQPRAGKLKFVARLLQDSMYINGESTMNVAVVEAIEDYFVPAAQAHFAECVDQAREMVPEMRDRYHEVRKGHLAIYADTLEQIRRENTFGQLQKRSDKLVSDCRHLGRPQEQKATNICDLYRGAEDVSSRYEALMALVASKTGTKFHSAPRKGLLRVCEKLAMAAEWKPEKVLDVVRGAIECPSFSVMINVLRLLCDLDTELQTTGEKGGVEEDISITRSKGRFGQPTSGGWADIMINFRFQDDGNMHVCEVQLVHAELYGVRKNMGAHETYNEFRAALELCEKVGADPEDGGDASVLEALVWKPGRRASFVPDGVFHLKPDAGLVSTMVANQDRLVAILEAQVKKIAALEAQNEKISAQVEKITAQEARNETMSVQIEQMVASVARLEAR
jgi:hypothetical protein